MNSGPWAVVWAELWNKRVWADYEQFLRPVFSLFWGQKSFWNFFENTIAFALKSCIIPFSWKFFLNFLLTPKTWKKQFFWSKNLSVSTWRSGPEICSLICETELHPTSWQYPLINYLALLDFDSFLLWFPSLFDMTNYFDNSNDESLYLLFVAQWFYLMIFWRILYELV